MSERLNRIRSWCHPAAGVIGLVLGLFIFVVFGQRIAAKVIAIGLVFAGCMVFGLRLLILQYSEDRRTFSFTPVCSNCGYNLTGNTSSVCPECGRTIR